jgi:predicted phage tail protein
MLRNVYLHGTLGEKFGDKHRLDVSTASEAIRALSMQLRGLEAAIRNGEWHVVRGKTVESGFDIGDEEMLVSFNLGNGDLHIVPVIAGSKRSGLLKIVLGVVLIGAAFAFAPAAGGLGAAIGGGGGFLGGFTYGNLAMVGVALVAAGASQLLSPEQDNEEKKESFLFNGPGNSYSQGNAVPLVYGEVITGGQMASGGMDIEQLGN